MSAQWYNLPPRFITILETFEKGFFGEKNVERFADTQRFTDVGLFKQAWDDYSGHINELMLQGKEETRRIEEEYRRKQNLKSDSLGATE